MSDFSLSFIFFAPTLPPVCPHFAPTPNRLQSRAVAGFVGLPPLPPVKNMSKVCALTELRCMARLSGYAAVVAATVQRGDFAACLLAFDVVCPPLHELGALCQISAAVVGGADFVALFVS
jgi:hypothetical protein